MIPRSRVPRLAPFSLFPGTMYVMKCGNVVLRPHHVCEPNRNLQLDCAMYGGLPTLGVFFFGGSVHDHGENLRSWFLKEGVTGRAPSPPPLGHFFWPREAY